MRLNRSFARRVGKNLSPSQRDLLQFELPKFKLDHDNIKNIALKKSVILEIGFGMGEHFVHQAQQNPEALFLGAEPYLNGVANVLKLAKEQGVNNFLLWPDDLDIILNDIPDNSLDGIYILFPDPWPKRRHQKKRILNTERFEIFKYKLKKSSFVVFASDIADYFDACRQLISNDGNFKLINEDFNNSYDGYITTKYHQKSLEAGRNPQFLKCCYNRLN